MIKGLIDHIKSGKIKITQGFTFFAQLPDNSPTPHYCIVFNKRIVKNTTIIYFYMTSQKEKVLMLSRNDKKSVVILNESDYSPLNKETFIQCDKNHLCQLEYTQFIKGIESGEFSVKDKVSKQVISKIKAAINESKTYSFIEKKELLS